jgi:hypothetical protein
VAGYTAGRGWIEMLRIDHANHILGLRVNVFVAAAMFVAAVIYLIATRHLRREDPAVVHGITPGRAHAADAARKGSSAVADTGDGDPGDDDSGSSDSTHADPGDDSDDGEPGAADSGDDREETSAGDDAPESGALRG